VSAPPTAKIVGRVRATKTLVVSFREDPNSDTTTRQRALRVGDAILVRGNPLQGSRPWRRPRVGTIDALYKDSWVRFLVPRYRWVVGVPIWEFFRWVEIGLDAAGVAAEPAHERRSVWDLIRCDWMRKIGEDS